MTETGRKRRFVAYFRVSTAKQGASGLGLEAQREAVRQHLGYDDSCIVAELTEVESGKRNDRPKLAEALALCRVHKATLLIAKLDRLARNVHFISGLMESKVDFIAVDMPLANRLTIHVLAAVAEHEAEAISTRTKAALAAAKARGVKLGGDRGKIASQARLGAKASASVRQAKASAFTRDLLPTIQSLRESGASLRSIAGDLNERRIPTLGDRLWYANSVRRLLSSGTTG